MSQSVWLWSRSIFRSVSIQAEEVILMKILMVCQRYYPEVLQNQDICEQLVQDGHEVTIVTGLPNYDDGIVREEYRHGKHREEVINGVKVYRTFEIGRRHGPIWRTVNYLSYMFSASAWAYRNKIQFDVVFAYQLSPVLMICPGVIVSGKQHIPLYVYSCDLWPESIKAMLPGESNLAYKAMLRVSRSLYSKADAVSVQSKSFFDYFETVDRVPREKLSYIPHMASSEYLDMDFQQDNGVVDFVFLGNIGSAQDIDLIINAVEKNRKRTGFAVHFVGDGMYAGTAKQMVKDRGLEDLITFYGRQPVEAMPEYYKLADVCLAALRSGSVISQTIPSKVQGYMSAGVPILAALEGFGAEVINESGAGICTHTGDLDAFSEAMSEFITNYDEYKICGENARAYFKKHFTKRIVVDSIEERLTRLVEDNRVPRSKGKS